jgi:hypothetical protein
LYRIRKLGSLFYVFFPISMHRDWRRRWLETFDGYTPKYQSKLFWFREHRFHKIRMSDEPIRMSGRKSLRQRRPPEAESVERAQLAG